MDLSRFAGQMKVTGFGQESQKKLSEATVLIAGMGGLGCPVGLTLATSGVGRLVFVDSDAVEESNLYRQPLYCEFELGLPKVQVAALRLRDRTAEIQPVHRRVSEEDLGGIDLVVDAMDDWESSVALSAWANAAGIPVVFGGLSGAFGVVTSLNGGRIEYVFPGEMGLTGLTSLTLSAPQTCAESGTLGAVAALTGQVMALEAIKVITGWGENLGNKICWINGESGEQRILMLPNKNAQETATIKDMVREIQPEDLADFRRANPDMILLDVRETDERQVSVLPGDVHIPIGDIQARAHELNPSKEMVVYCRSGARSASVIEFLATKGFSKTFNLAGGINRYARDVDPSLTIY
jgi:adenylyltransferase/sulfurtransferase